MISAEQRKNFIARAAAAAAEAQHPWPEYAACEAALESTYGASLLARDDNNLFGMKQHQHPIYGTAVLPTREFLHGQWQTVNACFVKYPTWRECFADRVATLQRMAPHFAHYAEALRAATGEDYVLAVSATWSTDPARGDKVLAIYNAYCK